MSTGRSTRAYGYGRARLFAACAVMTCSLFCQAWADSNAQNLQKDLRLKIYLPREVTVKDSSLSLGQISIVRGSESLAARANKIAIGRFSLPGQEIVIDRHMVLSRLACNGIPTYRVTLTGAEKITVKQKFQIVRGDQLVSVASSFIKGHCPQDSGSQWNAIRTPKDFAVPGAAKSITFSPRLVRSTVKNQARVEIAVLSGVEKIGVREVTFTLKYSCRQAVAKVDVAAGATISADNVRIEEELSNYPEPAGWKPPFGLVAKRLLPANAVIRPQMVGPVRAPIIVKRNQSVLIRIESLGFLITAAGTALQDGKAGEHVKVRNADSRRIIIAKINADGSAEPVL
jgi:flagella basal body P-ring formation protein FlgA